MNCKHDYLYGENTILRCADCVLNLILYMKYLDSTDIGFI